MTNRQIDQFFTSNELGEHVERTQSGPTVLWVFQWARFPMFIQTQSSANRMRIVAQIVKADEIPEAQLTEMLEANYHSALDARYALTQDIVVSAFIHPLAELSNEQFLLGLYQVASCAATFGSAYSGGTMTFGLSTGEPTAGETDQEGESETMLESIIKGITAEY